MVTFGIKPKTFPSSYHMSLAVIPVPQVQFQPSPLIWKKKKSQNYVCVMATNCLKMEAMLILKMLVRLYQNRHA